MPFSSATSTIRCISFIHSAFRGMTALPVSLCILAAILATAPAASWGRDPSATTFDQAYRSYCSVLKNRKASRENWLQVIDALAASANPASKESRPAGLLYAGRASIELFLRSRRNEDLDRAIRLLDRFKAVTRDDGEWITGLKELKRAHRLRRGQTRSRSRSGHRLQITHRGPSIRGTSTPKRAQAPARLVSAPPTIPERATEPGRDICFAPEPASIQGNPFYMESSPRAARQTQPVRQAALQPSPSVVDVTIEPEVRTRAAPVLLPPPDPVLQPPPDPKPSLDLPSAAPARRFVMVIDPGHGGKDPGAVSSDGKLKEKDVTLAVAKRVKTRLEAKGKTTGITVSLTRSDDSFLTVSERTARANAANADLFLSIHCNAYSDASASGVETYYLSKAKSRRAMMVAARENGIPLSKMTDLEATLLDLVITSKKSESEKLAHTVHESLIETIHLSRPRMDRGVRQAPFYVLLGVTVPAVLVECAYMSNSGESAKLANPRYLDLVAQGIARGAEEYVKGLREVCRQESKR